ncbi:MAG: TIGR01777 family oxidoreductase [Taibaiella sp.]|nr:TIGR01777 family oxidoreductase [Taibaiella sp.]
MKIIGIAGGTGLTGRYLSKLLADDGYEIIVFTRKPEKNRKYIKNTTYALFDPIRNKIDKEQLAKVDAMVNLAGEGIADKRWTEQRKTEILESRVIGTRFLTEQLRIHATGCKVLVNASAAAGYYGPDNNDQPFTESDGPANDFLGRTCAEWERASEKAEEFLRRVILRFGIVLAKDGGYFYQFYKPMRFGILPVLGSGEQVVSWIHIRDLARMIRFAIERVEVTGIYNAVAPLPANHILIIQAMTRQKKGLKIPISIPAFLLKPVLGEMSTEVLKSCTVSSEKITEKGFKFDFRDIETAVKDLLAKKKK